MRTILLLGALLLSACSSMPSPNPQASTYGDTQALAPKDLAGIPKPLPSVMTKTAFIARADLICAATQRNVSAVALPRGVDLLNPAQLPRIAPALSRIATLVDNMVTKIQQLPAPAGDADTLQPMFQWWGIEVGRIQEAASDAEQGEFEATMSALIESTQYAKQGNNVARDYGFEACADEQSGMTTV